MRGNGGGAHEPGAIEARGAFADLVGALEDGGRRGGNGGGNGGGGGHPPGGGGGDGRDGDFIHFVKLVIPGLRRLNEVQSDFTKRSVAELLKLVRAESARQNEMTQQLSEGVTLALRQTADWAERVATLTGRVAALEHHLAAPDDRGEPS